MYTWINAAQTTLFKGKLYIYIMHCRDCQFTKMFPTFFGHTAVNVTFCVFAVIKAHLQKI